MYAAIFFCVFLRKKTADFFKDVNLCVTQNTTAAQGGQDITVVLHSICESCYDIPGHWKDHRQKQQKKPMPSFRQQIFPSVV